MATKTKQQESLSNPFEQADPWEVSTGMMLPEGNYLFKIETTQDETAKSSGKPKLIVELSCAQGSATDYIPYSETFLAKIVALFKAAQIPVPQEGEFDLEDHCRLTDACRKRLHGKYVGGVIRNEEDSNGERDANGQIKMWPRVKGYVTADQISGGGGATRSESTPVAPPPSSSRPASEPDVPFKWDEGALDFDPWHGHSNR